MKKLILLSVLLWASISVNSQNLAVWTHQAANTDAFKNGCPGGWPYAVKDIGNKNITADLLTHGWVQMTKTQLEAAKSSLANAKETWNGAQEIATVAPKRDREALIKQAKADLTTIIDSSGTLTAAQLSNAVRTLAKTLRAIIEDIY